MRSRQRLMICSSEFERSGEACPRLFLRRDCEAKSKVDFFISARKHLPQNIAPTSTDIAECSAASVRAFDSHLSLYSCQSR